MRILLVSLICFLTFPRANAAICGANETPVLIEADQFERHYVWQPTDNGPLWKPTNQWDVQVNDFKTWVRTFAPIDQMQLLKIQYDMYKQFEQYGPDYVYLAKRGELVMNGHLGKIEQANCYEQFIFLTHISFFHPKVYPGEYSAMILQSTKQSNRWKIYFSFADGKKYDAAPPPFSQKVMTLFTADLQSGEWLPYGYVHSHPFMKNYAPFSHIGGTVLPSNEDTVVYIKNLAEYGFKIVSVTTGLHTIRFFPSDLNLLKTTVPQSQNYFWRR